MASSYGSPERRRRCDAQEQPPELLTRHPPPSSSSTTLLQPPPPASSTTLLHHPPPHPPHHPLLRVCICAAALQVMRKNRELRDQQLAEAERLAQIEKRERDREAPGLTQCPPPSVHSALNATDRCALCVLQVRRVLRRRPSTALGLSERRSAQLRMKPRGRRCSMESIPKLARASPSSWRCLRHGWLTFARRLNRYSRRR